MGNVVQKGVQGIAGMFAPKANPAQVEAAPFDLTPEAQFARKQSQSALAGQTQALGQGQAGTSALIQQLMGNLSGQGPSLAEAQLKSATNRNLAQQLASAAAQRGGNPAAQQRMLMQQQGAAGQALAEQAGQARLQEAMQNRALLGQVAGQQQAISAPMVQNLIQQGYNLDTATKMAQQQRAMQNAQMQQQANMLQQQQLGNIMGGVAGGLGQMVAGGAGLGSTLGSLGSSLSSGLTSAGDWLSSIGQSAGGTGAANAAGLGAGNPAMGGFARGQYLSQAKGGRIPGKAAVPGDHIKNDTVPAMLSPGEIVVPRTHATSPDKARDFVAAIMKKEEAKVGPKMQKQEVLDLDETTSEHSAPSESSAGEYADRDHEEKHTGSADPSPDPKTPTIHAYDGFPVFKGGKIYASDGVAMAEPAHAVGVAPLSQVSNPLEDKAKDSGDAQKAAKGGKVTPDGHVAVSKADFASALQREAVLRHALHAAHGYKAVLAAKPKASSRK